uniref:Uncharacterized protein n=1 Tax=Anguilla anguilla TaxID=7936 RepID=A0A0E9WAA3_ANGAN
MINRKTLEIAKHQTESKAVTKLQRNYTQEGSTQYTV